MNRKRRFIFPLLLLLGAACADGGATLRGTVAEDVVAAFLQAEGREQPLEVRDGSFEVAGIAPQPVRIRVVNRLGDTANLTVDGFPADAEVTFWNIHRVSDELAFPSAVELQGADAVRVNGVRMAGTAALPRQVNVRPATVLAVSGAGDALLLRPTDAALPDLRVLADSAVSVVDNEGEPALTRRLKFGDTVAVRGRTEHGYVIADTLVLPTTARRPADPPPEPPRARLPGRPIVPREITPEVRRRIQEELNARGNDETARQLRRAAEQRPSETDKQIKEREKELRKQEKQGRGRGKAKGKGKNDDGRR